jgi:hypothetical protein
MRCRINRRKRHRPMWRLPTTKSWLDINPSGPRESSKGLCQILVSTLRNRHFDATNSPVMLASTGTGTAGICVGVWNSPRRDARSCRQTAPLVRLGSAAAVVG